MSDGMDSADGVSFALDDVVEIAERRRWWLIVAGMLGLAAGLAAYMVLPAEFTSETFILVEPQEIPENYVQSTVSLGVEERLQTLEHRVTSHFNLNELIERLGSERFDPFDEYPREALIADIRENLVVEAVKSRGPVGVFSVSFTSCDPALARDVAEEIGGLFIATNIRDRAQQANETAAFLDRELERLRGEVVGQEEKLRKFREERMGSLPSQLDSNLHELDRLNLQLASNLEGQEAVAQRIALLQQQLSEALRLGAGGDSTLATLASLRNALLQARTVYTDEHPNVLHLKQEVARLEAEIVSAPSEPASEVALRTDPVASALHEQIRLARLDMKERRNQQQTIRKRLEEIGARVDATPRREVELQELTRDHKKLSDTYHGLLAKKYEAVIARNLEQAQKGERFKVLRPAQLPGAPSFPDLKLFLPGGLVLGLAIVVGLIAVGEVRNPSFRSVARVTRMLGLPVVASIPKIDNDRIYEEVPTGDVDPRLVVYTAPESSPAEQYRGFLPAFLDADDCRVILVTSAGRGDGKSLTTMNLAVSLATDLGLRVLLIDGDLRRPTAHRLVRISRRKGLSTILRGKSTLEDCAVNSKISNLSVLPAGPSVRNPVALLTGKSFFALLDQAQEAYDVVMIDSPPLLPVVDTKLLRKMADMVLFVVRADATPRDAAVRSLREMRDVAGVVFNEVSPGSFRRFYYYDAYSRYAYGEPSAPDEVEGAGAAHA